VVRAVPATTTLPPGGIQSLNEADPAFAACVNPTGGIVAQYVAPTTSSASITHTEEDRFRLRKMVYESWLTAMLAKKVVYVYMWRDAANVCHISDTWITEVDVK
jgi:hypothetical protein